jgi:hypothetical protein
MAAILVLRGGAPAIPSVNFAWDANAGGDNVTNYNLYYGNAPGTYNGTGSPVNVGNVTAFSIARPPSLTYYAVTAVNANGESGKSNELHVP